MKANTEERVKAVLDVFESKLIKRGISLKSLDDGRAVRRRGKEFRIELEHQGRHLAGERQEDRQDHPRRGPKSVKSQIQGDELRVSRRAATTCRPCMALLKGADLDVDLQFVNYR